MSVENPSVVDFIGVERNSGEVVLTISDHLDWEDEEAHLLTLQEKISRYLAFVESGEILTSYPDSAGRDVVVDVVAKYLPTPGAETFLARTRDVLAGSGFELRFRLFSEEGSLATDQGA